MVLENRVKLLESQVIKKENLYIRWGHATKQEIAELCEKNKLRTYLHHKGPINGVLFCVPAYVWHDEHWYHDEDISYFLLEDVERCEKEYPDFIGDVLTGPLSAHMGEDIPVDRIRKELGISRNDFRDFLNDDSGDRLVTSHEEDFRHYRDSNGYRGVLVPFFTLELLEGVTVERIDWENWKIRQRECQTKQPTKELFIECSLDDTQQRWLAAEQKCMEKDAKIYELKAALDAAMREVEKMTGPNSKPTGKELPPLKGHLDVIEILSPAIDKTYPLSQEVIDFLLEIPAKYPQVSSDEIEEREEKRKNMTALPVVTQDDLSRGWIEAKTFAQSFKAVREMYEFLFGELHATSVFLLNTMTAFYLEKDNRVRLEQKMESIEQGEPEEALPKTEKATEARQSKVLENWQAAFKIMVAVTLQCHADGPKKRTKSELKNMCRTHGGSLTDTQLDFLRTILGKEHVNTTGGPTVQD